MPVRTRPPGPAREVHLAKGGGFCLYEDVHAFVADIHLRPRAAGETERFLAWVTGHASRADHVFILGDLFDYWYTGLEGSVGQVLDALRNTRTHVLTGNRDFLLGGSGIAGVDILRAEEVTITIGDMRVLLAHGHTLAVSDSRFRLLHHYGWPVLARVDRLLPAGIKDILARFFVRSSRAVRASSLEIPQGIARMRGVDMVICGHLHRHIERDDLIVVPPFCDTGSWMEWEEGECRARLRP